MITGFEDVNISLFIPGVLNVTDPQSGTIDIQLTQDNEQIKPVVYDLLARLNDDAEGQGYLADLAAMRDYLLVRIQNEVLP